MEIHNSQVAKLFNEYADLLEILGQNPFRIRAYRNAAATLSSMSKNIARLHKDGADLTELPYIGKDLAQKIITIVTTGEFPELKTLTKKIPRFLSELLQLEGLGPKRVRILYEELHLKNMAELQQAIDKGKLKNLKGFGDKLIIKIQESLHHYHRAINRVKLIDAVPFANALINYLKQVPEITQIEVAGSFRRKKETVGDLDILVTAKKKTTVGKYFCQYQAVQHVLVSGESRSSVQLTSGLQIDLRVVPRKSFGAALLYFTGSKAHNIKLRQIAQQKGLKINEYGIFKGNKILASKTEAEMYHALGLPYIAPELREDRGEISAAFSHQLPRLISLQDICGDLHVHSKASDGTNSLEELATAAQAYGYEYIAITDHSKHLSIAKGLNEKRFREQIEIIDQLNATFKKFTLLKSAEIDILADGTLDLPLSLLKQLDLTICSIHSHFNLPPKQQTERIIRAMDNPYFNILGHPTGRLLSRREAYSFDLDKVMQAAKERGCFLELNAQPERLDIDDVACKMAKEIGVKIALSSDSHQIEHFQLMEWGIYQARRGWLEKKDVLNSLDLVHLKQVLKCK